LFLALSSTTQSLVQRSTSWLSIMGNATSGLPAPDSPSTLLRLRKGKRNVGCPCFLADEASTWDAITQDPKFRPYVLRHLLDEGFICSILEHGEREHALAACSGVHYYQYTEESQRGILQEKLEAWQRAAGAGITASGGLNSDSAFGELQLSRPLRTYGFLPTLQRRLAVLRELGATVAEEHRSRCRPFHMRSRAQPAVAGGQEQGDVRLGLMMNSVALQSLSALASLSTALQATSFADGHEQSTVDLVRGPFAILAELLEKFPPQNLFKYWSPPPSEPEKRVAVNPDTATASCSASLARLAVTGGVHVGWKSTATGATIVTWQVGLSEPATELTSVQVQWRAGDPSTGTDQNALPLALSIEASIDGGKEWHGITGGDEAVDVALAQKASPGSSRHRYPVSLLGLRRKREPRRMAPEGRFQEATPTVTHVRLKMKGAPGGRPGGALNIYDVSINAPDPSARQDPSDVMTVLRQLQTFLLTQHSRNQAALQDFILRALLGVCQASCALEFELDLVRVYMDVENAEVPCLKEGSARRSESPEDASRAHMAHKLGQQKELQAFVSVLLSAASRAKRRACRQDRVRVIRDAGFDPTLSSKRVDVSEEGQLVSSAADNGHSHSLIRQCLRGGTWSWELALERESSGDETTCVGVAVNPVTNSCYEDSHQASNLHRLLDSLSLFSTMWMVRCYSGETYSNGGRRNRITRKIHPLDSVRLTLNCDAGTLSLDVNGVDQGVVFSNVPPDVHPAVCFYGVAKSVRLVELKRIYGDSDSDVDASDSEDEKDADIFPAQEVRTSQPMHQASTPTTSGDIEAEACRMPACAGPSQAPRKRTEEGVESDEALQESPSSRRRASRREEAAVASTVRLATANGPSSGLLASLANLAQWYVPRGQGDQHGSMEHRPRLGKEDGKRLIRTPSAGTVGTPSTPAAVPGSVGGSWGVAGSGELPGAESGRYVSLGSANSRGGRQSSRLRSMMMGRPLPARRMSTTAAGTSIAHGTTIGGQIAERRRSPAQASTEAVGGEAATAGQGIKGKGKTLPLEEPYIIQPTAAVFRKLYTLLMRALSSLDADADIDNASTAASSVLSLLQILRANFCRLVDAHVDPAEVGLLLDYTGLDATHEARKQDGDEKLLPDILRCLQGIMLQQDGDPLLLRATVDTFTSGLPLLMPLVEDRLHLLLGLVWHLKSTGSDARESLDVRGAEDDVAHPIREEGGASERLTRIPRERITLLGDLMTHFSRTESVLQLLTLFERDEAERSAISDLLELMLTSMADMACPSLRRAPQPEVNNLSGFGSDSAEQNSTGAWQSHLPNKYVMPRLFGESGGRGASYWDQLVAGGDGGTTLNFTLLDTCQQHLMYMVLERDRTTESPHEILLRQYGQCLLQVCCRVLSAECSSTALESENYESPLWKLVGVLLPPFLHGLCMCVDRPRIAYGMLPPLVRLSEVLSRRINQKPREAAAARRAEEVLRQTQLMNPEEGLAMAPSGWHPVRASFEVDKESMTSFSVSDDGQLYSALTSNNTCALLDVGVSQGRAAWEFLLEDDSPSDECSVFGISTKPSFSRCYNSSQSLWMRRAYNGVLYNRGRQLPAAQSMSKIHPGDVVRCEVDMDEGTLRFSVNGEKQEGGFDDVEGEVFPCAGSYRSGVTIRLLKMEVMGGVGLRMGGDVGAGSSGWDPTEISWAPGPFSKRTRNGLVSIDKKAMEIKRMTKSHSLHQYGAPPPPAIREPAQRGSSGQDIPDFGATRAQRSETRGPKPACEETKEASLEAEREVERLQVADVEAWDWVSVRATRGFMALEGKHSVELEVTPVGTKRRRASGGSKTSGSEERNSLRRYPMAFGLCNGTPPSLDGPIGHLKGSWGWWTDGSLRAHGKVLVPAKAASEVLYGSDFLPLKPFDVITMIADTLGGTLRYLVNGIDAGIAFGPPGSGAVFELPEDEAPFKWRAGAALFPSCSLTNDKQVVQLRPGGTLGTQLWPLTVDLQKTVASVVGRLCATMVSGTPQDEAEVALEPWLRSPLLSGGADASEDLLGESAGRSPEYRSWDTAWNAEQQGQQPRTAFSRRSGLGAAGGENTCSDGGGRPKCSSDSDIRLTAHIEHAAKLPQGLVLWPDTPSVRLSAVVDGQDISWREEVLKVSKSSSPMTCGAESKEKENRTEGTAGEDQGGQRDLVLELKLPKMPAVIDREEDALFPNLSLRVEVLVGRVVAATGTMDVHSDELKASLSGSISRRVVVSLTGGGKITFTLDIRRGIISSTSSWEQLPQTHAGKPSLPSVCEGSRTQANDESSEMRLKTSCLEHFLHSVACHGSAVSSVKSKSLAEIFAFAEASEGNAPKEHHRRSGDQDESAFSGLVDWLGRSHPDPAFLRMALEKANSYAFPLVEAPFLAALLKHGGLVGEAFQALETISTPGKETDKESPLPVPSRDMANLWGRIRQLRAFLRTQKQEYKMTAAERLPNEGSVADGVANGVPPSAAVYVGKVQYSTQDETPTDEKDDGAGMTTAEQEDPFIDSRTRADVVDRGTFPATFDELCRQMTERANFLLELSPSTVESPGAAMEGTSVLMHHLAEELSDLSTPPPARLQSRLLRWRSEDHGKERWKGVVDVLRVRSQLRRSLSMAHRPRAKSLGNRPAETSLLQDQSSEWNTFNTCIEEDQAATEPVDPEGHDLRRTHRCSLGQADGNSSNCSSGDDSEESSRGALLDNETATSAAVQACTMYVITGGAIAPPRVLKTALRSRASRAKMRAFGLQALAALLRTFSPAEQIAMSIGASSAVQEALIFLRPAFQGLRVKRDVEGREVEVSCDKRDSRHHYLKGLEGCSAESLARVQDAFEDLYKLLRTLLDHSLRTGQPGLAHVLMTSWALDFESRDYHFLAQESGILPTLQAMVTLTNTASLASSTLESLDDKPPISQHDRSQKEIQTACTAIQGWTPWSLENIREGFMQGTLTARELAHHITRIPSAALPHGFLDEAGLHGSTSDIMRRHTMASLVRRYSALLRVHVQHTEARVKKMDHASALKRKQLEQVSRERVAQMLSRGVPMLDEREGKKSPEVQLTSLCSRATVPMVESVACTFARGVVYAFTAVGEAPACLGPSTNSGNYFEVTVMNPGEKTTIGIGLADPDEFPATKQMPGWVDHSYGYHGDDGRKFGRGETDSIWPTWVDGDVIGCGFDATRGSIWYTRNGELLGDGFVSVYESNLVPVVGFHSNGESVRVNFGLSPFSYEGPEVIIAPVVLAERKLLQRERHDPRFTQSDFCDDNGETADEEKDEGRLAEEKESSPGNTTAGGEAPLQERAEQFPHKHMHAITPEMMVPSMKLLQRGASSLLRFLVAVSMRHAPLARAVNNSSEEVGLQGSRDEASSPSHEARSVARGAQERSSPKSDDGVAAAVLPPTRERSMYGTPLVQTQKHVDNLHQDIFDLILRELRLGAVSLEFISSTSRHVGAGGSTKRERLNRDARAPLVGKLFAVQRVVKQEMQRSHSHGHSRAGAGSSTSTSTSNISSRWSCGIAWKGLDGSGAFENEVEDASVHTLGLSALEIGEVEPHVFRLLALLCSVRQYAVTRTQLAHPSALRSIFSLLKVGSPRMQRCILLLLGAVLPALEPAAIDEYLPRGWTEVAGAPSNSLHQSIRSGAGRDQENGAVSQSSDPLDGLVGVLFSTIRYAYSPPLSLAGSEELEEDEKVDRDVNGYPGRGGANDSMEQGRGVGQRWLVPGCDSGFGGGVLDLRLAEQCNSLLRELYKEPAWKERIARKLLLSIRTAASTIRNTDADGARTETTCLPATGQALPSVMSDAVAALAIISGGSGVLYPGAKVQSKSGVPGTVVLFSPGDAEAGVVFDGEIVETCETVPVRDLKAASVGFRADPDTPAQPVVAQLLSLLSALLHSDEVSQALRVAGSGALPSDVQAMIWLRMLSLSLMAYLQLSIHCGDAVVAACQEGDVVAHVLPQLRAVAVCPIQLPALLTGQEFEVRWRQAQARLLSAMRLGEGGLRTVRPLQRHPLPSPATCISTEEKRDKPRREVPQARRAHSLSDGRDGRDVLSAEESREEALLQPHPHTDYSDPPLEMVRPGRTGGRGRILTLGDPHRSWGRGWGSAMPGRRAGVGGARAALDWMGRVTREEDDSRREGGRRRLMRSDLSQRMVARGSRAVSAESRSDPRSVAARVLHEYDRSEGYTGYREDESGALLVEFNDGADVARAGEAAGIEGASAASADSADTSQEGEEMENSTGNVGNAGMSARPEETYDTECRNPRPPESPCHTRGEEKSARIQHGCVNEHAGSKAAPPCSGLPISHILEFGSEARAERHGLSARLSSEFGVPEATALAAVEASNNSTRARQWLRASPYTEEMSANVSTQALADGEVSTVESNDASEASEKATENSIVSALIGMDETALPSGGGDSASVPSTEEGLNLWESEEDMPGAAAPSDMSSMQCGDLLCEHDLVPVLGRPLPAAEIGGTAGTAVTTSCLVREADLLVPGSLLVVTGGEGYAPGLSCPCVTVASEMDDSVGFGQRDRHDPGMPKERDGQATCTAEHRVEKRDDTTSSEFSASTFFTPSQGLLNSVMDNEDVLVETIDAETGRCLGKRVPVGDLRHSTSFFGQELDDGGSAVQKLLFDTDKALSILRARSLLVRLVQSLPTPAIAAAGGPCGLLNITRLLAAQDLAKGDSPLFGELFCGGASVTQSSIESATDPQRGDSVVSKGDGKTDRDTKFGDTPSSEQDSSLKMLWRKVMDSPERWMSGEEPGSAVLGEMLSQEVLDSFNTLTTTSQTLLSGGWPPGEKFDALSAPLMIDTSQSKSGGTVRGRGELATETITHESLHPLRTPLSYGGHIKMDSSCLGVVVKLDSRSRTSSGRLQLRFFSSEEDMLSERDPVRTMHGFVAERAARAKAKGLEFFKIEEADSTSYDTAQANTKESLSVGNLARLRPPLPLLPPPPPAPVLQERSSSIGPGTTPAPSGPGSSRRPVLTSRAMTRAMNEVHSQMVAGRKARVKESPTAINRGTSFRSFALPGVRELWFRFDATPGAEKPPLQIVSLAGSLNSAPPGVVQAGACQIPPPYTDVHHDRDKDLTQEELGLQALFTCGGEERDREIPIPADTTGKSCTRGDAKSISKSSDPGKLCTGRPGCLATVTDVLLTSGKWFYEATVGLSMGSCSCSRPCSCPEAGGADFGRIRIGWAHAGLARSLHDERSSTVDGKSSTGHSGDVCARTTPDSSASPAGLDGARFVELQRQVGGGPSGPLMRTVSWLSESADSSSSAQEEVWKHDAIGPTRADVSWPSTGSVEGVCVETDAESNERSRTDASLDSDAFPILGSDTSGLGVGLGEEGCVWLGGRPRIKKTIGLHRSDVIGCAVDVDSCQAWFSVNGRWAGGELGAQGSAVMLKMLGWKHDSGIENGISPCFSVRGESSVVLNFGATPFKHPPPDEDFLPVILRDVPDAADGVPASTAAEAAASASASASAAVVAAVQTNDKRVTFAPESKPTAVTNGALPEDWGFRFLVEPLRGVPYRVVREMELVCRFGGRARSNGSSSTAGSAFWTQTISIWRPKAPQGWFSLGDVASRGILPPAGGVAVRADATGCLVSKPAKFRVVHQDKATGYVVWRPVARQGQVSLGDFACAKKASKGLMAGAVRCVAAWAVEACPVVKCLWREEKQSGTHAIWSVHNGLGTFFGSQTGGRMGKKEVTQGPHSRVERQKRKKKKKKKHRSNAGEESSEEDESERVKLQLGVGEGWALKGVSASCITNEWCQESDAISGPLGQNSPSTPAPPVPNPTSTPKLPALVHSDVANRIMDGKLGNSRRQGTTRDEHDMAAAGVVRKPQPSVSWASWLLSFILNHRPLRRLAMRGSLFRTLVAYLRSPGAPHRLRMVPLLTHLVRSHAEFVESPPPLEELSGLLATVLRECDKLTSGRGPRSAAWRSGDCPGGLQLETSWANAGLLLLTDLAMATRRAQDAIGQRSVLQFSGPTDQGSAGVKMTPGVATGRCVSNEDEGEDEGNANEEIVGDKSRTANSLGASSVKLSVPPFGTRPDEGPLERGEEEVEEAENAERSVADLALVGGRSLGAEERALLEVDLRNSVRPDFGSFLSHTSTSSTPGSLQGAEGKAEMPSRCLYHLLEIADTLRALRDGWPPIATTKTPSGGTARGPRYLDSILCEAWMDAVAPAVVVESKHPFEKGACSETIRIPGAEEMVVFLDPRSSMQEHAATLILEGKDKMVSLTGQDEAPWSDIITFHGDSISYRFVAQSDGEAGSAQTLGTAYPEVNDWGFRFTVVGDGPVWECARIEGLVNISAVGDIPGQETRIQGALSLLVELDQMHPVPPECSLQVLGYTAEGTPVHAGVLEENGARAPIYVRGDTVRVVPSRKATSRADPSADVKTKEPTRKIGSGNSTCEGNKMDTTTLPHHEPGTSATKASGVVDLDALPDADAKLERLPSNTPVLRAWGEATGVEHRWCSAGEGDGDNDNGMTFPGASYVSNAATVEVGDSDADSKDGSSNNSLSTGSRERGTWSRSSALDDVIATALPMLSAISSDVSESIRPGVEDVSADEPDTLDREAAAGEDGIGEIRADVQREEGDGRRRDVIGEDSIGENISAEPSSPRACRGAKGLMKRDSGRRAIASETSPAPGWKWAVQVQAAAMPRKARLLCYLQQRLSLQAAGIATPSLDEVRDWMTVWTPEMDKGLLELLGAAGLNSREEATSGRVTDALNPWCCRLTRAEARFQQQHLATVPAASLHIRAALLLRLNDRIERVLPVIDLASKQADTLGWQLREMNHLVLPHIKNAVLEAALTATQGPGDGVAVTLDNVKSMLSRDRGEKDLTSSQCVFAQAYRQLSETDPKILRTVWDGERVFQINFVGEDGVDAGGVFREGMSRMVEDLFSPDLDLLIPCPNGRHAVGQNNEKFVPNPQHSSPLALSMLRFVGRLMGLSLRTRLCLPFQLPGLIWKRML
ncbi:unnamed protein product, partial [Scytosiphon promiscuus]